MNFIDSNVIMYAAGRDHPLKKPAIIILSKIYSGEFEAVSSSEVLQEILYRYWSIDELDKGCQVFNDFISLIPFILEIKSADLILAKTLLLKYRQLKPRNAVHAAVMKNNKISTIISADKDFDQIPGIKRKDIMEFASDRP